MKRILFILNALFFALLVHADDYITVTHNFNTATTPPMTMEIVSGNKVGRMNDGTVYTCYGNARFTSYSSYICIQIPSGASDSVVISPPRERLSYMQIYHLSGKDRLKLSVSTDNARWTVIPEDKLSRRTEYIEVDPATLFGNYYVSLKSTGGTSYVLMLIYYSHPDCGCFPYVPEE